METHYVQAFTTLITLISADTDYEPISDLEIVFTPNELEKCVDITIVNDDLFEREEAFEVFIASTNDRLLTTSPSRANVTITSEDSMLS